MTRKTLETVESTGINHNGNWLYPFALQGEDDPKLEIAESELTAINDELVGGNLGDRRELNQEECGYLREADKDYKYAPSIQMIGIFSDEVKRDTMLAHQDGFNFAQRMMRESDFATYSAWKKLIRHHGHIKHWRKNNTMCSFEVRRDESSPDGFSTMIWAEGFEEKENLEALKLYTFLEGLESYFEGLNKNMLLVPMNNAYTRAFYRRIGDRLAEPDFVSPRRQQEYFDLEFAEAAQRYAWLYTHIEAGLDHRKADPYSFNTSMFTLRMRIRQNDEIEGSVLHSNAPTHYLEEYLTTDFEEIDLEIDPGKLNMGLEEIVETARMILWHSDKTEQEWLESWGLESVDDLDDSTEEEKGLNERRKRLLESRKRGIGFLQEHELGDKYIRNGKVDLGQFREKTPFWEVKDDWRPSARRKIRDELVMDLGLISGFLDDTHVEHIRTINELTRRHNI